MKKWINDYIGVPFKEHGRDPNGWDCYGLLHYCLKTHFGINTPSYEFDYNSTKEYDGLNDLILEKLNTWEQVIFPTCGDGVLLRIFNRSIHVGLVVHPNHMLHVESGIDTCLENYNDIKWNKRIVGFFHFKG